MKTAIRVTATVVATAALGMGGLALASAAAGAAPTPAAATATAGPGAGQPGSGLGGARNGMGTGRGQRGGPGNNGTCDGSGITAAKGVLTDQQRAALADAAQQEKLAHDLYAAFAAKYDTVTFQRITAAETRHLAAVRVLLDRYDLTDPTAGQPAGKFSDSAVQARYDRSLATGQASEAAAIGVGKAIEQSTVDSLARLRSGLTAPDVQQVIDRLLTASRRHLTAFNVQ